MKYGLISGFMYSVGAGVGEFLHDEEREVFVPLTLPEIVEGYVDECGLWNVFFLRRQIRSYIRSNMTPEGLEYSDDPFHQDYRFPEDYFEGDLLFFLNSVIALLNKEFSFRMNKKFRNLKA